MTGLWWAVTGAVAVIDWWAVGTSRRAVELWAKPATLAAMWLAAVTMLAGGGSLGTAVETAAGGWLLAGLALGLVGDVMLLGEGTARFQAGLGAFLLGHLAYVAGFVALGLDRPALALVGAGVTAVALWWARAVLPSTHRSGGPALSIPVGIYMSVIAAMAVTGWATGSALIGVGATVFVASDAILAVNRFVRPLPQGRLATMITYHVGQALIVLGVVRLLSA